MRFLKSPALWLALFQLILVCFIYKQVLFQPSTHLVCADYDGARTLFTIQTYVEQEGSYGHYQFMNYPYGEQVVFAGGTPAFSSLIRLLYRNGIISSHWVLPVYFWLVLISIPISGYLIYCIAFFILKKKWMALLLGLTLPWINYQIPRFHMGHFDLSMTCFLLLNLWLLILVSQRWNNFRKQLPLWVAYIAMLIFLAYLHLYLAAIIAVFTSLYCIIFGLFNRDEARTWKINFFPTLAGGAFSGFAFGFIMLLLSLSDPYASERKKIPEGYDWDYWDAQFSSIFTPSHGETINFPLHSTAEISYENDTYLGSFVIYGIVFLLIGWIFRKQASLSFPSWRSMPYSLEGKLLAAIFLSALISLFISFGEEFIILRGDYIIRNYFNLFLWIKKIYPNIQQFRVMARFNFYFFWAANLLVAFFLLRVFWERNWGKIIVASLLLLSLVDLKDRIKYVKNNIRPDNFVNVQEGKIPALSYNQYQAILPIPSYFGGNEDYNITIDPDNNWNNFTYYISYHSRLPLMASKMPRTSLVQARAQISLFMDQPDPKLLESLKQNGKPVLVVYNPALPRVNIPADCQPAQTVNDNFGKFMEREAPRLTKITTYNGLDYYSWKPDTE
jgi:hypothetical protein